MNLLEQIDSPDDLKKLRIRQLPLLAKEMREFIIDIISNTGGHLAPSLGVIELTIALLYVYYPPDDKIIWDVSHQAYGHKVLTGRRERMKTIRQLDGLSGFLKRAESPYDSWGAGHASTSISAALGFAVARDLAKEELNVAAVIGDGSLTGGLALEGLNNAGASGTEMLVILNDNAMSISKNVGALANYLTEIEASPQYQRLKADIWNLFGKAGGIGKHFRIIARKLEDSLKNLIVPGMLFEQMGFEYYGPVDGHDIPKLISVLRELRELKKPKLLHIITQKGKGYTPAERDATTFHGLGKFDQKSGEPLKKDGPPSYTKVFGDTVVELGERYLDLVAITAAMEIGTGLSKFRKLYPERFFDVGIAEAHSMVFGGALVAQGIRTIAALYSSFMQRAFDPVIHDIALQKIPLVIAMDRAGIVGEDGPTHHGVFDIAYLRLVPGIIVSAPKDEAELRNLLFTAVKRFSEPWTIRYPRGCSIGVKMGSLMEIQPGKWELLQKGDGSMLLLAVGSMVYPALEAAKKAEDKLGLKPTVVNCRFIKPIDEELLLELLETHDIALTIEEGTILGGFGEGIAAFVQKKGFAQKRIVIHGIPDRFILHGTRQELLEILGLDCAGILDKISEIAG